MEPYQEYKDVINTLKYKDEVTFCIDDLSADLISRFYVPRFDYVYLNFANSG